MNLDFTFQCCINPEGQSHETSLHKPRRLKTKDSPSRESNPRRPPTGQQRPTAGPKRLTLQQDRVCPPVPFPGVRQDVQLSGTQQLDLSKDVRRSDDVLHAATCQGGGGGGIWDGGGGWGTGLEGGGGTSKDSSVSFYCRRCWE